MTSATEREPDVGADGGEYPAAAPSDPGAPRVRRAAVRVDAADERGELTRIWESIGYDEINWTAMPSGRRLLADLAADTAASFHVRPHYVFCSGTGFGLPHWGGGNVYHEDENGEPCYDFTIVDQVYDAIVGAGHQLLVELAFTPRDLLPEQAAELQVVPSPTVYSSYEAGAWAYPPRDYRRWGDLVAALAAHCLERYGAEEVSGWLWELWNEPDIFYWRGSPEQFHELYGVTAEAVRRVLPDARVGGPAVTGGGVEFLRGFLAHTSRHGLPLDFVSFHTKGSAFSPWRVYGPTGGPAPERQSPSATKMIFEIRRLLRVIGEFDAYLDLPAIVDECDAGVPAHFSVYDNANFVFQNTEYYPVFQTKIMKKILDLNDRERVGVALATSWSFYFEGERYFEGTRALRTAGGIDKPFLNAYRMLAALGRRRLAAGSDAAWPVEALDEQHGRSMPEEVDVLASIDDDGTVTALVWRHTDDQYHRDDATAEVEVRITGLTADRYAVEQFRIDAEHSNAHTVWARLGRPQDPTPEQRAAITARQGLESSCPPTEVDADAGELTVTLRLPLPAVELIRLRPVRG